MAAPPRPKELAKDGVKRAAKGATSSLLRIVEEYFDASENDMIQIKAELAPELEAVEANIDSDFDLYTWPERFPNVTYPE